MQFYNKDGSTTIIRLEVSFTKRSLSITAETTLCGKLKKRKMSEFAFKLNLIDQKPRVNVQQAMDNLLPLD
jgi:hypothetical protein